MHTIRAASCQFTFMVSDSGVPSWYVCVLLLTIPRLYKLFCLQFTPYFPKPPCSRHQSVDPSRWYYQLRELSSIFCYDLAPITLMGLQSCDHCKSLYSQGLVYKQTCWIIAISAKRTWCQENPSLRCWAMELISCFPPPTNFRHQGSAMCRIFYNGSSGLLQREALWLLELPVSV